MNKGNFVGHNRHVVIDRRDLPRDDWQFAMYIRNFGGNLRELVKDSGDSAGSISDGRQLFDNITSIPTCCDHLQADLMKQVTRVALAELLSF